MKRLVLCFDGTWNSVANPKELTNVVKLANSVSLRSPDGTDQICYYNSGVGSGGPIDRFIGGAFGAGLKSNVKRGLAFLALNYQQGDEIYLFGFSRGAYTARAVAGVLGVAGIPLDLTKAEMHWECYRQIAKLQSDNRGRSEKSSRYQANVRKMEDLRKDLVKYTNYQPDEIDITCVGVFDTVGSYGVPSGIGLSALPHIFTYWTRGFHSRQIGKKVKVGLHAMAVDEMRRPFYPTFWMRGVEEKLPPAQHAEQVWFPGVHCNVGGGYADCGLSDVALAWMISRVQELTHLAFDESELMKTVWPCTASTAYRTSRGGPFARVRSILPKAASQTFVARALRLLAEPIKKNRGIIRTRVNETVHWSVRERLGWPAALLDGKGLRKYEPKNLRQLPRADAKPTDLEMRLLDRGRADWDANCPLMKIGKQCQCAAREQLAAPAAEPSRSAAAA
jgi:uncharacterized protein (DUF2235 family)